MLIRRADIWLIVKIIVATNICLLAGSYFANDPAFHLSNINRLLLLQTDLGSENVVAAWYSSVLLFCSAIMSFICFLIDDQRITSRNSRFLNYGWIMFTSCFAVLSFDELSSIHEHIGDSAGFSAAGDAIASGVEEPGWKLFYIVVALAGLLMLAFSVLRLRKVKWSLTFLIIGVLLYLSNPFQEHFEIQSMRSSANPALWRRPVSFLLLEEGSEVFGSLAFLLATVLYAIRSGDGDIVVKQTVPQKHLNVFIAGLLIALFAGTVAVHAAFFDVVADFQTGVPKNWTPAIAAFVVSAICFYRHADTKQWPYLIFGIFSAGMSVYYGCNRFNYIFTGEHYRSSVLMRVFILSSCLVAFSFLNRIPIVRALRIIAIISMSLLIASAFVKNVYYAELAVAGFCGVFLLFFPQMIRLHR